MIFLIKPVTTIVQNLSNENGLLIFLGLKGVTNSVNEFGLFYKKFLGFLIHHLEAAIAEIEADEKVEKKTEIQQPATPEIPGYTQEEIEAYDSLFGELPPSPAPAVEETIQPATRKAPVMTKEKDEEIETEILQDRILKAKTRDELDALKAENPGAVNEIWNGLSIPEKNQIKCIAKSPDGKKKPATLGYKFTYTDPNTKEKHEATYLGYYLHGQALTDEDQRAITVKGKGLICNKSDLRPRRKQPLLAPGIQQYLEDILSNPAKAEVTVEEKPTDTKVESDAPTATEMAANKFKGLVEQPKKSQAGLMTGKTESSQPSKQNAEQTMLDLKTPETEPETTTEAKPTEWLLAIEREINQANTELSFEYDSFGGSIYLEVFHGKTRVVTLEDNGSSIEIRGADKLKFHGITDEKLDTMLHPDFLQSPKA